MENVNIFTNFNALVCLYNAAGDELAYNYVWEWIEYELNAGETYTLQVKWLDEYMTGHMAFLITCEAIA